MNLVAKLLGSDCVAYITDKIIAYVSRLPTHDFISCALTYVTRIFLDSSMVEHSAVNRVVVGSSPTRGVRSFVRRKCGAFSDGLRSKTFGSVVKRLRHRPFTAVTRVRFPSESLPGKDHF